MLRITNYAILAGGLEDEHKIGVGVMDSIDMQVNHFVEDGWRVHGSPFVFGNKICQAIVKYAVD